MSFDYATLSSEKLKEIKKLEDKLNVTLLAFDAKYKQQKQPNHPEKL